MRRARSTWVLLCLSLAGCGGAAHGEAAVEPVFAACPCHIEEPALPTEYVDVFHDIGKGNTLVLGFGKDRRVVETGMDAITAVHTWEDGDGAHAVLAGCKEGGPVLMSFGAGEDADQPDTLLGTYRCPPDASCRALARSRATGDLYGIDARNGRVLRYEDVDRDGVFDLCAVFAVAEGEAREELRREHEPWFEDAERLFVADGRGSFGHGDPFVAQDADGDGVAERVGVVPWRYVRRSAPKFVHPPRIGDRSIWIEEVPAGPLDVWLTDAHGNKLVEDPELARLKRCTIATRCAYEIPLVRALRAGEYLACFHPDWPASGPVTQVHPPFPVAERVRPKRLSLSEGGVVTVEGTYLDEPMRVHLRAPTYEDREPIELVPFDVSATSFSVRIPPNAADTSSLWRLHVTSEGSPEVSSHIRLGIYLGRD